MRLFKRVGATVLVVLVVFSIAASSFATPVVATSVDVFSALYSTYLACRGISVVMSENNVASSSDNSIAADPAAALWQSVYDSYNGSLDSSAQMTIDQWSEFAQQNISTNVGPAGNVSPTLTTFSLSHQLVEWFDKLTTKVLSVDLGVPSESGVYHTGGNFFNSSVASISSSSLILCPVVSPFSAASVSAGGIVIGTFNGYDVITACTPLADNDVFMFQLNNNVHYISVASFSSGCTSAVYGGTWFPAANPSIFTYNNTNYYHAVNTLRLGTCILPVFDSIEDAISSIGITSSAKIQLRPEDKYNEGLRDGSGNVLPKGDVYVPDATAEGYTADTLTGIWDLPWSDSYADSDSLPSILDAIKELVNANEPVLELDDIAPDPVEIPFLPPGAITDLPSFDFSLSGIWHYVVDWVASLSSGFTLISSAWSALPYAMVIPIYASAVVVIVVGMWKRFFS